ncbi:hypothetical protein [Bacillus sp. SA1-12]|nr:hypothetical protein [Bacillus sp. SA1-12]
MWVITTFFNKKMKMYEFNTEREAREVFSRIKGGKILSEIVYFNDYE